jgi:hypothetical protein
MKITTNFFIQLFFVLVCLSASANAQQAKIKPLSVTQSNLINDLKAAKTSNPKITTAEFVKTANSLLEKQGLNFVVAFDPNTCQKISQAIANLKDKTAPLNLRTALKSPVGENANLLLPEVSFSKNECAPCFVRLPMLEATANDFVTLVEGKNIKFFLPSNFILNEAFLVDEKDLTTVKTRWKIPFRTAPLSVSDSGNILYLGFPEPELSDLALMAYGEGVFQFCAKSEIDADKKGVLLKDFPKNADNPNLAFMKFSSGETTQIIKFSTACEN